MMIVLIMTMGDDSTFEFAGTRLEEYLQRRCRRSLAESSGQILLLNSQGQKPSLTRDFRGFRKSLETEVNHPRVDSLRAPCFRMPS